MPISSAPWAERWFIENRLGVLPSFLERNLKDHVEMHAVQTLPVSECSSMFIQALLPLGGRMLHPRQRMRMYMHGYQRNSRFHNAIEISAMLFVENNSLVLENPLETRLSIFSCHNEITLYAFLVSGRCIEPYYASFFPCRLLRRHEVFLRKIAVCDAGCWAETNETPYYKLDVRVFSSRELHHNWEDPVVKAAGSCFSLVVESAVYRLRIIQCVFCFKARASVESLCQHIANVHMHFKAELSRPIHVGGGVPGSSLVSGGAVRIKFSGERGPQSTPGRLYFCRKRRKINRSRRHTFPYTNYLEPETFSPLGTKKKSCLPWQQWLVSKRLDEIIDLPEKQVRIIKDWTIFVQGKRVKPCSGNILDYVKEFVNSHSPSFEMFRFITCLYNNAVLSVEEVCEVVMERVL